MGTAPHISNSGGLQVGSTSELGGRERQQDELLVKLDAFTAPCGTPAHLFAVFDGHGSEGHKAAAAVKKHTLATVVAQKNKLLADPAQAFKDIYNQIHEELLDDSSIDAYMSGTTAVIVLLVGDKLHVSHVGDSRLVVVSEENGVYSGLQVTRDHTCDLDDEYARVKGTGARVEQLQNGDVLDGPLRIFKGSLPYPGIVVTRSLGDSVATKLGVLHEPEVTTISLTPHDKFLVLATDGLWDALSVKNATDIIAAHSDAQQAAVALTAAGLERLHALKLDDNTTTIVVKLAHTSSP
ncbi:hypothetical protein HK105_201511 [Polyrhizophydium stewartii]|uniref:PPM-type phosphatase domain-containing protein n=1 Tax=Polyrhizophydium stewartii TaxID=2732419 RepID=A0ABR4NGN4_9FUNG|nr:hypothetical protein HK105_005166 [Polyrhizophydium stewartii]